MVSNYSLAVSKVICIDLLNASKEDLHNYFLIKNAPEVLQLYVKHLYKKLHNDLFDTSNPHLIYVEDNYIVGTRRHEDSPQKLSLGHTEILPDGSVDKLDKTIFPLMENIVLNNKTLLFTDDLAFIFKHHFKSLLTSQDYNTVFIDAHIEVSNDLALNYIEFCQQYNLTIHFLDCEIQPDTTQLKLHKIYYKNQFPIIFVFKNADGLEVMGWKHEYLKALHNVGPLHYEVLDKKTTLNAILDKILESGLSSLTSDELSFLDHYSNS
jgi:hypothetical protein